MTTELEQPTTSIAQTPNPEITIKSLQQQAQQLLRYAEARVIQNTADTKSATDDLSIIAKTKKILEVWRKQYVEPLNNQVKLINDTFKTVSEPLNQADKITRDKILTFRADQERRRLEAEEINRQKEELAKREAALKFGEITVDTTPIEVLPEPPKHIYTDMGTAGAMKVWKFEIIDFSLLPDQYKLPDLVKIRKVITAGVTIAGVRAWQEESLRITTK